MRWIAFLAVALFAVGAAAESRPVTEAEKARIVEALTTAGCSGGEIEHDEGKFEVEEAVCADGKTYDLVFDAGFALIEKKLED